MKTMTQNKKHGFTLVEVLIAITIASIVIGGAMGVMSFMNQSKKKGAVETETVQNVRTAVNTINKLLSNAGFNGPCSSDTHKHGLLFSRDNDATSGDLTSGTSVCFTYWDMDPAFKPNSALYTKERRVHIYFEDNCIKAAFENCRLIGGVFMPAGEAPVVLANNIANLKFTYYDATGAELEPTADTLANIRKISFSVKGKQDFKQLIGDGSILDAFKSFSLTGDVRPVNLGILGQSVDSSPPTAPTGLKVTDPHISGQLHATWNKNPEADIAKYIVYFGSVSNDYGMPVDAGNALSVYITKLPIGVPYYVAVAAVDSSGNMSPYSTEVFADVSGTAITSNMDTRPDAVNPNGPVQNLKAVVGAADNQIVVSWTKNPADTDVTRFEVWRKEIANPSSVTAWVTPSLSNGTKLVNYLESDAKIVLSGSTYTYTDSTGLSGCKMYDYCIVPINGNPDLRSGYPASLFARVYGDGNPGGIGAPVPGPSAHTVPTDGGKPGPARDLIAVPGNFVCFLSWTNPDDADFDRILIKRSSNTFPSDPTFAADEVVFDRYVGDPNAAGYPTLTKGSPANFMDDNKGAQLNNGICYYYTAWAYDKCGNRSVLVESKDKASAAFPTCSQPCNDGIPGTNNYGPPPAPPLTSYKVGYNVKDTADVITIQCGLPDKVVSGLVSDMNGFVLFSNRAEIDPMGAGQPFNLSIVDGSQKLNAMEINASEEGSPWYYFVRTYDCVPQNSTDFDGATSNILQLKTYPGRVAYDDAYGTQSLGAFKNIIVVPTKNTSAARAVLNGVKLEWSGDNTENDVYLSSIDVWDGSQYINKWTGAMKTGNVANLTSAVYLNEATGPGSGYSSTNMKFTWTRSDGTTVDPSCDMSIAKVFITYNYALQYSQRVGFSSSFGSLIIADALTNRDAPVDIQYELDAPKAPTISEVTQNKPISLTTPSSTPGLLIIPADDETDVTAFVTDTSTTDPQIGIESCKLFYAVTEKTVATPPAVGDLPFVTNRKSITNPTGYTCMTTFAASGAVGDYKEYKTTRPEGGVTYGHPIPANNDKRLWYFLVAKDNAGKFTRSPVTEIPDKTYTFDQQVGGTGGNSASVRITSPAANAALRGSLVIKVNVGSTTSVTYVQVKIDSGAWVNCTKDLVVAGQYNYTWNTLVPLVAAGPHTITAQVTAKSVTSSDSITVNVDNSSFSAFGISAPVANSTVSGSMVVKVLATSNGTPPTAVKVSLDSVAGPFSDCVFNAVSSRWEYTYDISSLTAGAHRIYAVGTVGSIGYTANANITVTVDNSRITVTLDSPVTGSTCSGTPTIQATVNAGFGIVNSVKISIDGAAGINMTSIGGGRYTYPWNTTTASFGSHTINITATDTWNRTGVVNGTLTVDNSVVTVTIASPVAASTVSGSKLIQILATSTGSPISTVEFQIGAGVWTACTAVNYGNGPHPDWRYEYTIDTTTLTYGLHTINARATTTGGAVGTATHTFNVDNSRVTVSINSPLSGANLSGTAVPIVVAADTNTGGYIISVTLSIDGGAPLGCAPSGSTWTYVLDTTTRTNGSHTIVATGKDNANKTATATITVSVANINISNTITAPLANTVVNSATPVTIGATCTSAGSSINQVQYRIGAAGSWFTMTPGNGANASKYSATWTPFATNGANTITVRAYDGTDATKFKDATINITINNLGASISSPASGAANIYGNNIIRVAATGGATECVVLIDGVSKTCLLNGSFWEYTWDTLTATNGSHTIQATVSNNGVSAPSSTITVTVLNVVVNPGIINPAASSTVGGTVNVAYSVSTTPVTALSGVQVSIDGGAYATATLNAPPYAGTGYYVYSWVTNVADVNVSHSITAQATTSNGITGVSNTTNVLVNNTDAVAPTVSVTGLVVNGTTQATPVALTGSATKNKSVVWTITATDNKAVTNVTVDNNQLTSPVTLVKGTGDLWSYTYTMPNSSAKTVTFKFNAYDAKGNVASTALYTRTTP